MTCITVVSDGTRCCMAADSQATNGGSVAVLSQSKIDRIGPFLVAAEGGIAVGQFVRHHATPVLQGDLVEWAVKSFAPELRKHLESNTGMRMYEGRPEFPGQILIAKGADWILMDTGGSVVEIAATFWAIGSGAPEARGCMWHAIQSEAFEANNIAVRGVEAAIAMDNGCCGPVCIEWTEP